MRDAFGTFGSRRREDGAQPRPTPREGVGDTAAPSPLPPGTGHTLTTGPEGNRRLRVILVSLDATAVAVAGMAALFLQSHGVSPGADWLRWVYVVPAIVAVSLGLLACQGLYQARVAGVRAAEFWRLGCVGLAAGVVALAAGRFLDFPRPARVAAVGAALSIGALAAARGWYWVWLQSARRQGRFLRPVVIVGANEEGLNLSCLVRDHPELGLQLCGVLGRAAPREWGLDVPLLGEPDDVVAAVRRCGANEVLIACSALPPNQLNRLIRDLLGRGIHVSLSNGLMGIDYRRLRPSPLAHEPLFSVEPVSSAGWQLVAKRALDLVLALLALVALSPVVLVAAAAIKLEDRGPVLIRQRRIGRHGEPFTMLKLRTMVPDAAQQLPVLAASNGRDGPLFKVVADPRVTRVGRFLRASSIDELPQLLNVIKGAMSLVGPRPALPGEVAGFDREFRARERLPQGITGLWQVEARDNPSFAAYRRLDLFYVENWSLRLDLAILAATVRVVIGRTVRALRRGSRGAKGSSVAVLD